MLPLEAAVNAAFAGRTPPDTSACCSAGSCRCGRRLTLFCRKLSTRAHIRRCRGYFISSFCRESPGNVPFWHVMPWSLHFIFRGGPPCQRISGLNVSAIFRRDNTGCGTRPGVRSPDGASCAATGIFLMAGVIKPLTRGAASTVRRLKNRKAAHTVRPAPTPGPLTLALTFLIHFNDRIKRITRLRTLFNHLSVPALSLVTGQVHLWRATSPAHNGKNPRMTSRREADTTAPPAYCRQRSM